MNKTFFLNISATIIGGILSYLIIKYWLEKKLNQQNLEVY